MCIYIYMYRRTNASCLRLSKHESTFIFIFWTKRATTLASMPFSSSFKLFIPSCSVAFCLVFVVLCCCMRSYKTYKLVVLVPAEAAAEGNGDGYDVKRGCLQHRPKYRRTGRKLQSLHLSFHVHIYPFIPLFVLIYDCVYAHVYTCVHIYMYIHINIYIYIYIQ